MGVRSGFATPRAPGAVIVVVRVVAAATIRPAAVIPAAAITAISVVIAPELG
jgi:hypothetical protein